MPGVRSMTPGSARAGERLHQRVHAEAQRQIEHQRAVLDQQVGVAVLPDHDRRPSLGGPALARAGSATATPSTAPAGSAGSARSVVDARAPGSAAARRASSSDTGTKRTRVAGLELADLPQLRLDDRRRADEAAQARTVGAEDDRHVAGEVDGADRVGVVVDVRGVQPRLAAVGARPARLRARSAARRCGWSCGGPSTRSRTARRCPPR